MKLWQKVFLASMAFVMIAVGITTAVVAQNYFTMTFDIEKQGACARHGYIASGISNRIMLEELSSGELILSPDELKSFIRRVVSAQTDSSHGIAVYDDDGEIAFSQIGSLIALSDFRNKTEQEQAAFCTVTDYAGTKQLIIGSPYEWSGRRFYLYTSSDITPIYQTREESFAFIRLLGIISAAAASLVLLIIVYRMVSPLSRINASIRKIAGGVYDERVGEYGGYEFRELSGNINQMAESIEENVTHLQHIADSRKRFVDDLAHEMKTPLTSIICLSDVMLIKKDLTENERMEYAGIVMDEAKRLRSLSGKLMELTVAENAELDLRNHSLSEILTAVGAAVKPVFERSGVTLRMQATNCVLCCDKELFSSMLLNLIDNARKASAEGDFVEVRGEVAEKILYLFVTDHGIGMSGEELRRITEPFYMADKSRTRSAGGAGLGLSLCAEIAKRHNAVLSFKSSPGSGTTVTLEIPLGGEGDA